MTCDRIPRPVGNGWVSSVITMGDKRRRVIFFVFDRTRLSNDRSHFLSVPHPVDGHPASHLITHLSKSPFCSIHIYNIVVHHHKKSRRFSEVFVLSTTTTCLGRAPFVPFAFIVIIHLQHFYQQWQRANNITILPYPVAVPLRTIRWQRS